MKRLPQENLQPKRRASALIAVLIAATIASISVSSLLMFNAHQRRQLEMLLLYQEDLAAAENAVNSMTARIAFYGTHKPRNVAGSDFTSFEDAVLQVRPPALQGFTLTDSEGRDINNSSAQFVEVLGDGSPPSFERVDSGQWAGYVILERAYRVSAYAKSDKRQRSGLLSSEEYPGVLIGRTVKVQLIPPYAYAIFFNGAGGIDAGPEIDIIGKVHINGDLYGTKGGNPAWYHEHITVAGNFYAQTWDPTNLRMDGRDTDNLRIHTNAPGVGSYTHGSKGYNFEDTKNPSTVDSFPSSHQHLDSTHPDWERLAVETWGDYLRDSSHGVQRLDFPLPEGVSAQALIARPSPTDQSGVASEKLANKADLVVRGDPKDSSTWTVTTGWDETADIGHMTYADTNGDGRPDKNVSWIEQNTMYNARERKVVYSLDINMNYLNQAVANGDVSVGDGIVYVSPDQPAGDNGLPWYAGGNTKEQSAVRIVDAENIPTNASGALTLATDAPLYTKGDVNSGSGSDRDLLLLAADAVNVLSNAFDDEQYDPFDNSNKGESWADKIRNNSPQSSWSSSGPKQTAGRLDRYGNRINGNTITNAIFMGGEVASRPSPHHNYGRYSGGGENWFRYLENWGSSNPHVFNGSMLNMFESAVATASWDQNSSNNTSAGYYNPPKRVWSWDPQLAGIVPPPGFPLFWRIEYEDWAVGRDYETDPQFQPPSSF